LGKKLNKNIYVATNFLETMIVNNSPTRGEVNDIYSTLEMGANGFVLAAETAIGKYPIECVQTLQKIIKIFHKNKKKF
jgi:pyruvate kinase